MAEKRWIAETILDDLGVRMTFRADKVLYELQTEHHHLILFEQPFFGKTLMLDGATQISTRDEFVYHEMMTHVPLFAHGNAREVLIIGGGDCGSAEEVLKHKTVTRLTQVEIDVSVVEFSKEHFPQFTRPVLADKRFDLIIDDGMRFVTQTDRRFDIIIVDSTGPQGPGKVLFTNKFYAGCRRSLAPGGILTTQNGVPLVQPNVLKSMINKLSRLFAVSTCFVAPVPTHVGGHMAMGFATDDTRLLRRSVKTIAQRYRKAGSFPTKYWTPEVHVAAFAQPRFIADLVARAEQPGATRPARLPQSRPLG